MFRRTVAIIIAVLLPTSAIAGPIRDSIAKAAQDSPVVAGSTRPGVAWPGLLLVAGGAALVGIGLADKRGGRSDGRSDGRPDSDQLMEQPSAAATTERGGDGGGAAAAIAIGGAVAALVGTWLVVRARRASATAIVVAPGRVGVRHSFGF